MTDAKFMPKMALEAGLQIDIEAVEPALRKTLESEFKTDLAMQNAPMLNDPKTMVALVNANAVVGIVPKDSNNDKKLDIMAGDKVGISCTICHTITDKAVFDAAIEMPSKSEIQRRKAIVQEIAQRKRAEAEAEMLLLPTLVSSSFKRISIPEIFGRGDLR